MISGAETEIFICFLLFRHRAVFLFPLFVSPAQGCSEVAVEHVALGGLEFEVVLAVQCHLF